MEENQKFSAEQIIQTWLDNLKDTIIGQICEAEDLIIIEQSLRKKISRNKKAMNGRNNFPSSEQTTLAIIARLGYTDQTILLDQEIIPKSIPGLKWSQILRQLDKMTIPDFALDTQKLLVQCISLARSLGHPQMEISHVLLALIHHNPILDLLQKLSISERAMKKELLENLPLNTLPLSDQAPVDIPRSIEMLFFEGWRQVSLNQKEIEPIHVLLSILWKQAQEPSIEIKNTSFHYVYFRHAMLL